MLQQAKSISKSICYHCGEYCDSHAVKTAGKVFAAKAAKWFTRSSMNQICATTTPFPKTPEPIKDKGFGKASLLFLTMKRSLAY